MNNEEQNNNDSTFADMTFKVDGNEMNLKEFVTHMNNALSSDEPHQFLPHLGALDKHQTLVLIELTAAGLLNPSYSAYGFMLINTLATDKKQVFELYQNGVGLFNSREVTEQSAEAPKIVLLIEDNKKPKKNNKNNNKNKN